MRLEFNFQKVSFPQLSKIFRSFNGTHWVLTWVDKRLTVGYTSTVSRINVPFLHFHTRNFSFHFNIIFSSKLRFQSKNIVNFLFFQNIKLNFPIYMWHILFKFAQTADRFIALFHYASVLLLLLSLLNTACDNVCFRRNTLRPSSGWMWIWRQQTLLNFLYSNTRCHMPQYLTLHIRTSHVFSQFKVVTSWSWVFMWNC
jgi:hypothetical protein